jgi:hypothetical protein
MRFAILLPLLLCLSRRCYTQGQGDGSGSNSTSTSGNASQRQLVVTLPLQYNPAVGIAHAAAVMMALQHARTRYTLVVQEFSQCDPTSTSADWNVTFLDSASSTAGLIGILGDPNRRGVDAMIGGFPTAAEFTSDEPALVGFASQLGKPLVLYGGGNERNLMRPNSYVSRIFPSVTAYGAAIVDYLYGVLNRTNYYGLVVEQTSGTALQYMQALLGVLSPLNNQTVISSTPDAQSIDHLLFTFQMLSDDTVVDCLKSVKHSGYRTLLFLLDDEMYPEQLAAMARVLASPDSPIDRRDYLWVLVGNLDLSFFENAPEETLAFAMGAIILTPVERFMWVKNETFPTAWNSSASNGNVQDLERLLPNVTIPSDYYTTTPPQAGSGFIYDAVAALVLATTCQSTDNGGDVGALEASIIANRIRQSDFRGASGHVIFATSENPNAPYPGARADYSATFGAYSVLQNGTLPLIATRGAANSSSSSPSSWKVANNASIVYASGSTVAPPLRSPTDQNLLTPAARIWGCILFGALILFLAVCAIWLFLFRDTQIVRATQPVFLGILILGSLSVGFCIVTNTFDEGAGWSEEQLSKACTATPWLLICGIQLIYSSIFCKLYRIDKVLQFRRRKVTMAQVVWPMASIFVVVLIILSVWTALQGFDWQRTEQDPFTGESSAKCQGQNTVAWFTPIFLLMVVPVVMTAVLVYKTRDIDSMYSETSLLAAMILFQVQLLVVTIPLLILVEKMDTVTRYVVQVTIFFLLGASSAGFLIVPRMWRFYYPKSDGPKRGSRRGTVVSGIGRPGANSANYSSTLVGSGSSGDGPGKRGVVHSSQASDSHDNTSYRSVAGVLDKEVDGDEARLSNNKVKFSIARDHGAANVDNQGSSSNISVPDPSPAEGTKIDEHSDAT